MVEFKNSGKVIRICLGLLTSAICHLPSALYSQFTITPTITNATCSADSDGTISVSVSGGSAPYTYQWLPDGQTTPTITGLTAGIYSVTITDNAGADSVVSYSVGPSPIVNDTTGRIETAFCTSNGKIVLGISGGTSPYSYSWNTGSTLGAILQLNAGTYSVMVTDANTCTASFSFVLAETECFVSPAIYFTPNGDGYNDTWFIGDAQYFPDAHLVVFDRWGTKVYEHKGLYESWDGRSYLGVPVPDAVYYYFFFRDKNDKQKRAAQGSVTIIR